MPLRMQRRLERMRTRRADQGSKERDVGRRMVRKPKVEGLSLSRVRNVIDGQSQHPRSGEREDHAGSTTAPKVERGKTMQASPQHPQVERGKNYPDSRFQKDLPKISKRELQLANGATTRHEVCGFARCPLWRKKPNKLNSEGKEKSRAGRNGCAAPHGKRGEQRTS